MTFDYEGWLKTAQDRLEILYQQKTALESEISALESGIKGFAPLVNQPSLWRGPDIGITEAVTNVIQSKTSRLWSAVEVRDELISSGIPLTQQNPLATIYQVLARLHEKGAVIVSTHEPGKNRYKWVEGWETEKYQRPNRKEMRRNRKTQLATGGVIDNKE
jgi:hypothetical protein